MAQQHDDVVSTLNTLIETCKDGQEGFRNAAENARDPDLKRLFMEYSGERARFAAELQAHVRELGGSPERSGSVAGALHRGWMNVKATLTGLDDAAILDAAETGEDSAKTTYEETLSQLTTVPASLRASLERQALRVREVHDAVRALRDRRRAA